jgi:hypothetical protein
MATMIDADERVGRRQLLVGHEELQVGAGCPAVQQQHGGSVRIKVAISWYCNCVTGARVQKLLVFVL